MPVFAGTRSLLLLAFATPGVRLQPDALTVSSNQLRVLATPTNRLKAWRSPSETSRFCTVLLLGLLSFTLLGCGAPTGATTTTATNATSSAQCEGYWPPAKICLPLGTNKPNVDLKTIENAGCPQWRIDPDWARNQSKDFLQKLSDMEKAAMHADIALGRVTVEDLKKKDLENGPWVNVLRFRGLSPSRFVGNEFVNSSEFTDVHGKATACWPAGYLPYYVKQYHVLPSGPFQDYVQKFDLSAFSKAIRVLENDMQEAKSKLARNSTALATAVQKEPEARKIFHELMQFDGLTEQRKPVAVAE